MAFVYRGDYEEAIRFVEAVREAIAEGAVVVTASEVAENRIGWQIDGYLLLIHQAPDLINRWLVGRGPDSGR